MGEWSDWNEMHEYAAAECKRRAGETSEETRARHARAEQRAAGKPIEGSIYEIVHDFMEARLPLDSVSSHQIRCVAKEIAQAIEARRAETTKIGSVADESAVPEGNVP
jgi:hypothetical protein